MRKTEFELETERIRKCADELINIGKKYEVLDFIEALGAVLGIYLMTNGGRPALELFVGHMLRTAKWAEETEGGNDGHTRSD
jgi:hypothetical protein